MFGARGFPLYAVLVTAITGLILLSSFGTSSPVLPSNWESKYLTLKDDIRTLAIDPLDPRVIYIGTNRAIISTSDGGENWATGKSFRIAKVDLSSVLTKEALQAVLSADGLDRADTLERLKQARAEREGEWERQEEARAASEAEQKRADKSPTAKTGTLTELEEQLGQAQDNLTGAENARSQAEVGLQAWQPDPLTVAKVEGLPYESEDTMEATAYDELGQWLTARGLSVSSDARERQSTLVDYLKAHEALRLTLTNGVNQAGEEVTKAQNLVDALREQVAQARKEEPANEESQAGDRKDWSSEEESPADSGGPGEGEESLSGLTRAA